MGACRRRGSCLEAGDLRAAHAVDLIGKLFAIERQADADAVTPEERRRRRRAESEPILNELGQWMAETYNHEPPKSPLAKAIYYSVSRWKALSRFLENGALPLHNNAFERGLPTIAIGRKNYLFADSDAAAERAATLYTLVVTATLHGLDSWAYLEDVLEKLAGGWPQRRIEELLPPPGHRPPADRAASTSFHRPRESRVHRVNPLYVCGPPEAYIGPV